MRKLTIEYIKDQFVKEGYVLLTIEYINNYQKLEYICPNGHKHCVNWNNWKAGQRCPYCAGNGKPTIEFIRSEFEKKGYTLLTIKYLNNRQKLSYICPNGHRHNISWNAWKNQGQRCVYCAGQGKPTIEFIKAEFEREGYELLTTRYINAHTKLKYKCSEGHEHQISWTEWCSLGNRCPYCADRPPLTINFIRAKFEKENYILLTTEYINSKQKLFYICPKSHRHSICWNNWQHGQRCPECTNRISKGEIEVRNFVESLGIAVLPNDRSQIFNPETGRGFELDVFIPNINKAIEYNGEYWHKRSGRTNNDNLKRYLCKQNNVDLLVVWDYEWLSDNSVCKNKIKKFVMGL